MTRKTRRIIKEKVKLYQTFIRKGLKDSDYWKGRMHALLDVLSMEK